MSSLSVRAFSALEEKSLDAWRRPGTHLAAFSSVGIRPGIPPSSALRVDAPERRQAPRNFPSRALGSLARVHPPSSAVPITLSNNNSCLLTNHACLEIMPALKS